ncbi:MAG: hypothetical protein WDN30_14650 [Pararobbsia sp.]
MLVPNGTNPYFAELTRGIEDFCERHGYCVILGNSDDNAEKQRKYMRVLIERAHRRADHRVGGRGGDTRRGAALRRPADGDRRSRGCTAVEADLVTIDHGEGAYMAVRHLLELGHVRIACICGLAEWRSAWRASKVFGAR